MPFELVHEGFLTPDRLDRFKVLVLADAAALSDAQCEAIRGFVSRGGSVVATFASSLYDEWGQQRKDFGLADLFGVSFAGRIDGPMQNSYLNLDPDPSTRQHHAVLRGLEDAPRIINGVFRIDVKPALEFPSPITLVPSYPDLPMEDVYPRVPRTQTRELYLREIGRGRVAYIPWDIDRTFWEVLSPDHGTLLRNILTWAMNQEPAPVEVDGRGIVDVTVWRQQASMTVHLVNLTNPMMMKGPLREIIPIGPLTVRARVPNGLRATKVKLLTAGTSAAPQDTGGTLTVRVPTVEVHEVVAIDLEPAKR
jgi:hypothetical protein